MNKLINLVKDGYEDLWISKDNLVKLLSENSHNIPLLVDGRKVWIHFHDINQTYIERDISDGSAKTLNV